MQRVIETVLRGSQNALVATPEDLVGTAISGILEASSRSLSELIGLGNLLTYFDAGGSLRDVQPRIAAAIGNAERGLVDVASQLVQLARHVEGCGHQDQPPGERGR